MIRVSFCSKIVAFLLIVTFPMIGNSCDEGCDKEFKEAFSEYLVSSGEYFCVSELFSVCFSGEEVQCSGDSGEDKLFCLNLVEPLYSSKDEFDPNVVLGKYLNCIVDKQLSSFPDPERDSYRACLGASFKNK